MQDGIQAVYFDAVGTLIHPVPPAAAVYAQIGRRFGSRLNEDAIAHRFQAAWAREETWDREHGYRTSEAREMRRWRAIVASVLHDVADAEACFQQLYGHFARPEAWACTQGAGSLLKRLAQHGVGLGLASNYDHRLHHVVDGMPELRALEKRVISSEVGWRKPAAEFFAAMIEAAAVPAPCVLYLGDDPLSDYRGAEMVGIQPALFDAQGSWDTLSYRRIGRLDEVETLLK